MLLLFTVFQRSIGLGRGVIFCRWLSPETLGEWEMAYAFLLLAAPLTVLGIPGSFGRYVEHFRQKGHLRTFLRRTLTWTVTCSVVAVIGITVLADQMSVQIFGSPHRAPVVYGVVLCLVALILMHTLTSLLTALRLYRVVSVMNFIQGVGFAAIAVPLLFYRPSLSSIITAFGVSCAVASVGALLWVWPGMRGGSVSTDPLPHGAFWSRLLQFAFFVWLTNALAHLFGVVDRYSLLHWSDLPPEVALEQIGNYHSSRIVPLLLISFGSMLSGVILPHLSHDWEMGRKAAVGRRLRFILKLTSIGMMAFSAIVLAGAPLLFNVVLQGKYNAGLAVAPWTIVACLLYALFTVLETYLWCAERTRCVAFPLAIGLVANTALNFLLVPRYGLQGAVVATAISTCLCLALLLTVSRVRGLRLDRGVVILCFAPITLAGGASAAFAAIGVITLGALGGGMFFNKRERLLIANSLRTALDRLGGMAYRARVALGWSAAKAKQLDGAAS